MEGRPDESPQAQAEACGYICLGRRKGWPDGPPLILKGLGEGFGEFFISVRASALSPLPKTKVGCALRTLLYFMQHLILRRYAASFSTLTAQALYSGILATGS